MEQGRIQTSRHIEQVSSSLSCLRSTPALQSEIERYKTTMKTHSVSGSGDMHAGAIDLEQGSRFRAAIL